MIIIMLIFIILFILEFLIIKFCQTKLKIILTTIIFLITCYCLIFSTDMKRIKSLKEPIFAKIIQIETKDNNITYKGLGYRIKIEKLNGNIIKTTMSMFNKIILGVIT